MTKMRSTTPSRVLAGLLLLIATTLVATHLSVIPTADLARPVQVIAGVVAGFGIGSSPP